MNNDKKNLTLITGGARSGKSELAEEMAFDWKGKVHYLATMARWLDDPEGAKRIEKHRRRRPKDWDTIEAPQSLDRVVAELPAGPGLVIVDCLSLYVSNLTLNGYQEGSDPYDKEDEVAGLIHSVLIEIAKRTDLKFIVVTNEVGCSIVPENRLGRAYRDFLGSANQHFAQQAVAVWLMVSGLKMRLK
jgi:adenosylcobinamide kinase/adenosylcobinamide-phosphate guanylyltransferase